MLVRLLADGPPLDPTAQQARELLRRELADPVYQSSRSLLERVLDWLAGLVGGTANAPGPPASVVTILVLALLLVGAVAVLRTIRRESGGRDRRRQQVFGETLLGPEDYRGRALRAAERGAWDEVAVDAYRALATESAERGVLLLSPGVTAMEVERALARAFPGQTAAIEAAAATFDRVRYGGEHADPEAARAVLDLGELLSTLRPGPESRDVAGSMP